MRTIRLQTVHKRAEPLGLDPTGLHRMDSNVCMHALHRMSTDTGRWPRTGHNYDTDNVKSALIYTNHFIIFCDLNALNNSLLCIVLLRLMYQVLELLCIGAFLRIAPRLRNM
jgi:hypothetical protein